jgi:hypothetical protein
LPHPIEIKVRVCRPEIALDPPQGKGASKAVRILLYIGHCQLLISLA